MDCRHRARRSVLTLKTQVFFPLALVALCLLLPSLAVAQAKRVVLIKVDGLPSQLVDRFVSERDPRTGKSQLPWIDYIFYQNGTRLNHFYVRGMSLSAPSWSTLDSGQHLQVKGNVEFDRYTMHAYDYLNFIPFYLKSAAGTRIDMPGAEVLDSLGVPLLADAYAHEDRYISFQLYQRGMRFATLKQALQNNFMKHPRQLLDEWTMGLDMRTPFFEQMERELITKLDDPKAKYMDLYISAFDHVAHHNRDRQSHMATMQEIDRVIGRIWSAIQKGPLSEDTALILVSDHGFNTDEQIYSQGYNLVKFLGSTEGGGHHVITKRRLMLGYSLKGINFLVPLITTTSDDSFYLKGQSTSYPTVLLDFDGNERAAIHLRNSDLNMLHILFRQLQRNNLSPQMRGAVSDAFFKLIDTHRPQWQNRIKELDEELAALRVRIAEQTKLWEGQPKKFTPQETELGYDDQKTRVFARLQKWTTQEKEYVAYLLTLRSLLTLQRDRFQPAKVKIEDFIAMNAMGERNTIYQLQNYIVGIGPGGLVLDSQGALDLDRSFERRDYFSLLHNISVRNNVQPQVSNKPIDMIAIRIPSALIAERLNETNLLPDSVWVYGGADKQALILARRDSQGQLSLRYQPIKDLRQSESGELNFETTEWQPGFPFRVFEDEKLATPAEERKTWLSGWHTDSEWLRALHETKYSNGVIGVYEAIALHPTESLSTTSPGLSHNEKQMRRFATRQRSLVEPDLQLVANDHWNFDVRGFNPGGNHGAFFRISTHSTLMFSGGNKTGIPRAAVIDEPYDSMSFVPTVLALTGQLGDDNRPVPQLQEKGFRRFPAPPIKEVLRNTQRQGTPRP
ncbi:MAG TPA: alkaline phosphatase family protein [Pyrinomonadaceae bacterium]|nr:alkaline phosphatase family protein [Pyrinomonadaceae bacterium]